MNVKPSICSLPIPLIAIEQRHAKAQTNLGFMYEYGYGVTKDMDEAIKWWKKAARQGNENAQSALKKRGCTW